MRIYHCVKFITQPSKSTVRTSPGETIGVLRIFLLCASLHHLLEDDLEALIAGLSIDMIYG